MSKSGLGKLPWWMNTYKSKIIKELEKVKYVYPAQINLLAEAILWQFYPKMIRKLDCDYYKQ